jgi:hypothetical protein
MSAPHDSLHQPPNPDDLRQRPPKTGECAFVRGLLRDFVDGDLEPELSSAVEEHASLCRTCSIELGRTEHERMQLRNLFAAVRKQERAAPGGGRLPAGFAAGVVRRLVVDETSMVSAESLRRAAVAADAARRELAREAAAAEVVAEQSVGRGASVQPLALLVAAAGLLALLALGAWWFERGGTGGPASLARLVVLQAEGAFDRSGRRLDAGSGIGEDGGLSVDQGGNAVIDWHDMSNGVQPAATLKVRGLGQLTLEDGAPVLVRGRIDIETNRPVSIPLGDGTQLDLGIGDYVITADAMLELLPDQIRPEAGPGNASTQQVQIEVLSGEAAMVTRTTGGALVAAGQVGIYVGAGPMTVRPNGGGLARGIGSIRSGVPTTTVGRSQLRGEFRDPNQQPAVGASVFLSYIGGGAPRSAHVTTTADGSFRLASDYVFDSPFAVLMALPSEARPDLGFLGADAVPLVAYGQDAHLAAPVVFDASVELTGQIVDDQQVPVHGVQIVPCIYDELFGGLIGWQRHSSGVGGMFHIRGLPGRLPPHQSLVLLLYHTGHQSLVMPVPLRSGATALEPLPPLVMPRAQMVELHWLPKSSTVELIEELVGLPARERGQPEVPAYRRFTVATNSDGRVVGVPVGSGRMWRRFADQGVTMLDELALDAPLRYRPRELPVPMSQVVRALDPVTNSSLEMVPAPRFSRLNASANEGTGSMPVLRVRGEDGHWLSGAQVFAIDASATQLTGVRFLGLTNQTGAFPLTAVREHGSILVLAADGSLGTLGNPRTGGLFLELVLESPGRVLVAPALRPAANSLQRMMRLVFRRQGERVNGFDPIAVRFACESNGWEVGGLPPGEYKVTVGTTTFDVVVPSGGFVELHP